MARGFFGGKMGGGARMGGTGKNISRTVVDKNTGMPRPLTPEELSKKLLEEKMASFEKQFDKENKYSFQLPGTVEKKEKKTLSKNAKATLEKIAAAQAKRKAAKEANKVEVKTKYYGGLYPGRIESNGKIFNGFGECIGNVNLKNGKIVNKTGITVGKYKADSGTCDVNISRMIASSMTKPRPGAAGAAGGGAAGGGWNPMTGGIGGGDSGNSGSGSIYGDAGSFWGKKDDDDKGWW